MRMFKDVGNPQFHRSEPGRGTKAASAHYRKISVAFSAEDFAVIRLRAKRGRVSFAEAVRVLVTWGLDA